MNNQKICTSCKYSKNLTDFYKNKNLKYGVEHQCKKCRLDKMRILNQREESKERRTSWQREFRKNNPDKVYDVAREGRYRRLYGITPSDYYKLVEEQDHKCAICRTKETGRKFFDVDHDHTTKKVRGLLCGDCNRGIGLLKESIDVLKNAASYLESNELEEIFIFEDSFII